MLLETDDPAVDHDASAALRAVADEMVDLMLTVLSDGLDHPELWAAIPDFLREQPMLVPALEHRLHVSLGLAQVPVRLLMAVCGAALGETRQMLELLAPMAADYSQSPLVQGVLFHLNALLDPQNPKYQLAGRICPTPFVQMDVLETSAHLCCASWLNTSVGDLSGGGDADSVWNSDTAQAIRASIHDGSYRYCNKGSCPTIQSGTLVPADEMAGRSEAWRAILAEARTRIDRGPEMVNLAYDRTCNLSCPSCRTEAFAADADTRARFATMQERAILPLLKDARLVFVTGSGDPFASKNFRQLMTQLTPEAFPQLRFQIMTNGMLFTPREWDRFPALHGRVQILKISTDAAFGPTHERLRRGARWPVMLENMAFAGRLTAAGLVDHFELVFTVQQENYREMGDAVDLAHRVGATGVYFARLTNWGTFSADEYQRKAVFLPRHPDHDDFVRRMADPRLRDPIVLLGDLDGFVPGARKARVAGMATAA